MSDDKYICCKNHEVQFRTISGTNQASEHTWEASMIPASRPRILTPGSWLRVFRPGFWPCISFAMARLRNSWHWFFQHSTGQQCMDLSGCRFEIVHQYCQVTSAGWTSCVLQGFLPFWKLNCWLVWECTSMHLQTGQSVVLPLDTAVLVSSSIPFSFVDEVEPTEGWIQVR